MPPSNVFEYRATFTVMNDVILAKMFVLIPKKKVSPILPPRLRNRPGILRDKTIDDKLIYIPNDDNSYFSYRIINGFPRI